MTYYFSKTIEGPFDQAVARTREALSKEGFGVVADSVRAVADIGVGDLSGPNNHGNVRDRGSRDSLYGRGDRLSRLG